MCSGGKQIFDVSPKAECATFILPGAVSEQSCHFYNSIEAARRSAVPLAIKAAEFSVSALQPSQHCCNLRSARVFQRRINDKKKQTSSVYDCTVKDVEYICNILRY